MTSLVQLFFDDSSSSSDDDDLEMVTAMYTDFMCSKRPKHGGSVPGRALVNRKKQAGHVKLMEDYFVDKPIYGPATFRRRFRMSRDLFLRIANAVEARCPYFVQRRNASGQLGHSALKKVAASVRMLAYGCPADSLDDWVQIAESTVIKSLKKFVKSVVEIFGEEYLRAPNAQDTAIPMDIGASSGFPGMLGCIDCMHWKWKNCHVAWHGQFTGHCHDPTVILEAVASEDLWIWHAYFGLPGSHNDINVLQRSPLFARLAAGEAPPCEFEVNGHQYTMGYYLADGIYPSWATFVKTISNPQGNKQAHFAQRQEACRKAVDRAFGVLQSQFAIVSRPARFWDQKTLWRIMTACVIMHNMIIEDERGQPEDFNYDIEFTYVPPVQPERDNDRINKFLEAHRKIEDHEGHNQLHDDLIEHLWQLHGQLPS